MTDLVGANSAKTRLTLPYHFIEAKAMEPMKLSEWGGMLWIMKQCGIMHNGDPIWQSTREATKQDIKALESAEHYRKTGKLL